MSAEGLASAVLAHPFEQLVPWEVRSRVDVPTARLEGTGAVPVRDDAWLPSREVTDEIMRADLRDQPAPPPRRAEAARIPPPATSSTDESEIMVKPAAEAVDRHEPPPSAV